MSNFAPARLSLFVHRASECLTDHEAHGDGLICFSLLNALAERGHQVYAFADTSSIRRCSPNLHVKTGRHRVPANSLAPWELAWRAERWRRSLERTVKFDVVWRMHPYGNACPMVPRTGGRPLLVGPLFYDWPDQGHAAPTAAQPRMGVGLEGIAGPIAKRGWQQTLDQASLILCATDTHAEIVRSRHPRPEVSVLPVMVEPPPQREQTLRVWPRKRMSLLFAANLVANKNPLILCGIVCLLRAAGIDAEGTVLGDGPERPALEAFCAANTLSRAVCFRGKVPNDEVFEAMREADFLVSTSFGEPYGRGIAEAMSVGTPAICHHSGGPADFISDGQDGLLVRDLTPGAYASRLQAVISEPNAWDRLSKAALQKAQEWRSGAVLDKLENSLYQAVRHGGEGRP